jgi:hypothetical protein
VSRTVIEAGRAPRLFRIGLHQEHHDRQASIGCGDISAPPLLNAHFHHLDYSYGHWGTTTRTSTEPYGKDITQPRSPVPPTLWPAVASHRRVTTSRSLQPCAPQMQREVPHMAQSWSSRLSRAMECLHTTSRMPQIWASAKLHISLCLLSQLHAGRGRHLDARLQLGRQLLVCVPSNPHWETGELARSSCPIL